MTLFDLVELDTKLANVRADGQLDLIDSELRSCMLDLAACCNVLTLAPTGQVVRGSLMHERMQATIERLETRLDRLVRVAA